MFLGPINIPVTAVLFENSKSSPRLAVGSGFRIVMVLLRVSIRLLTKQMPSVEQLLRIQFQLGIQPDGFLKAVISFLVQLLIQTEVP
jgi:hypothetical protein